MSVLLDYDWPGNIKELESTIEYSINNTKGNIITIFDLPDDVSFKMENDIRNTTEKLSFKEMKQKKIDCIIVGADRIASNGDTANKIGTYNLAVLAKHHKIPFYIVAPHSTFDLKLKTGNGIKIEQRDADEIKKPLGIYTAPRNVKVDNPAFDVTPNELITAIISDRSIINKPFEKNIKKILT